jgi:hypothetical protein
MTAQVGGYAFEGPYTSNDDLKDEPGLYAVVCQSAGNTFALIDVGESAMVKKAVENHTRKESWTSYCRTGQAVAVFYTPDLQEAQRQSIEQEIRKRMNPPCR